MIIVIFLFILLFPAAFADAANNETLEPDWKGVAEHFNTMANAAPDGLAMMKILKGSAAEFLKIAMSVGGMFAAAIAFGPDSTEQKLITAMDLRMQKGFNQTALNIKYATKEILLDNLLEPFKRDIVENMDIFNSELTLMKKGTRKTKEDVSRFVNNYCLSTTLGPLNLLRRIRHRLRRCFVEQNTTQNIDNLMVEWKMAIRRILAENVVYFDYGQYETCTDEIFELLSTMTADDSENVLRKLERSSISFTKTQDACNSVISLLNEFPHNYSPDCILERMIQAKQYKHNPLHQFSALVGSVSLNLLSNGIYCGNIIYSHNPEALSLYNSSLLKEFENIGDALLEWIPANLNRSWPDYEKQVVNDIIQLSPSSFIERKDYDSILSTISHNLSHYGNVQYRRQSMISANFKEFEFFATCIADACFKIKNDEKRVRVVVTRYLRAEYRHSLSAKKWADDNLVAINNTIKAHRHTPFLKSLDVFFYREHGKHFLNRTIYNSMVILRDMGTIYCSITKYAIMSFHGGNKINGVCVVNPKVFYDFEKCVQFKLIFFI